MRATVFHLRQRHRGPSSIILAASLVLVAAWTGIGSAEARTAGTELTSVDSRRVIFAGTTFASGSNENVDVAGTLHVVATLVGSEQTGWALNWSTNLADTMGRGQTTDDRYLASGSDRGLVLMPPGPPTRAASVEASFRLHPPAPIHPPSPIRLSVTIVFDESGRVADIGIHVIQGTIGPSD
jgi:hypothetical protein